MLNKAQVKKANRYLDEWPASESPNAERRSCSDQVKYAQPAPVQRWRST
jgi:hypothetical protein